MVQGHTVDVLLSSSVRDNNSILFQVWYFMRGITAPLFMFTSGAVYSYLLFNRGTVIDKFRVKKGILRGIELIVIGYLLRYPSFALFDFSYVTYEQWKIFFAVDALHLIGIGIIFISASSLLLKKYSIYFWSIISLILLVSPIYVFNVSWINSLPIFLVGFFSKNYGSIFPLFPYLAYVLVGASFGIYLQNFTLTDAKKRTFQILIFALVIYIITIFVNNFNLLNDTISSLIKINFERLSIVFLLISITVALTSKVTNVNKYFNLITKNTLFIYIVHVVLLYGSAWSLGINRFCNRCLSPLETIVAVISMMSLMFTLVIAKNLVKNKIITIKKNRYEKN